MRVQADEEMVKAFGQVDLIIAATSLGPAFPADATTSSPTDSFLERAQTDAAAKWAFRRVLGGARVVSASAPGVTDWLLDRAGSTLLRPQQHGRAHHHPGHLRQPSGVEPGGDDRWPPRRHAGPRTPREDVLLVDVALGAERECPWPLVAPSVT